MIREHAMRCPGCNGERWFAYDSDYDITDYDDGAKPCCFDYAYSDLAQLRQEEQHEPEAA